MPNERFAKDVSSLNVSMVIPTNNRPEELRRLLNCLLIQTISPREIIVIDDSKDSRTENLISQNIENFLTNKIMLRHVRNRKEKNLTSARNLGVKMAEFEIVMFLDDDVVLNDDYVEEILNVYRKNVNAIGVQGYIEVRYDSPLLNAIGRVFYLSHHAQDVWRILPSGEEISPVPLSRVINCPRLSGANQSYRRFIFKRFKFDETLKGYGFGEDKDFSFRVYKEYGNCLYATPYARLVHNESNKSRLPKKSRTYMTEVYGAYFFCKNIPQTFANKVLYVWSRIGQLLITLGTLLFKKKREFEWQQIMFLANSYLCILKHYEEIRIGNLAFFNEPLKRQTSCF